MATTTTNAPDTTSGPKLEVGPPQVEPSPRRKLVPREYVVFMSVSGGSEPAWVEVGRATHTLKDGARDIVVDRLSHDEQSGTFTTVPARAWQPQTPQTATVVKRSWA